MVTVNKNSRNSRKLQQADQHIRGLYVVERNSCADTVDTRGTEVCGPFALLASCHQQALKT